MESENERSTAPTPLSGSSSIRCKHALDAVFLLAGFYAALPQVRLGLAPVFIRLPLATTALHVKVVCSLGDSPVNKEGGLFGHAIRLAALVRLNCGGINRT